MALSLSLGPHQDIARAVETLGSYDISQGITQMGCSMRLLQLDMALYCNDLPEAGVTLKRHSGTGQERSVVVHHTV